MAWEGPEPPYIRTLLDGREKWATVLSLTAVAGLFVFLWDKRPHGYCILISLLPFLVGILGSAYLFVVALYYEQAKAIEKVRSQEGKSEVETEREIKGIEAEGLRKYAPEIGVLGRINIAVPVLVGVLAALALLLGPKKP